MSDITLIFSAHRETGLCNANALLKILCSIRPEVAFTEIPAGAFDLYYQQGSVEAHAIAKYRELKPLKNIPVDQYHLPADQLIAFKRALDDALDAVAGASEEYRLLEEERATNVSLHGFHYLNSAAFAVREARKSEIEDATTRELGDLTAMRVLEKWRDLQRSREEAMVASIYEYCIGNKFERAVFLVGAAHRTGIRGEIDNHAGKEAPGLQWQFYDANMI